ncbi:MAG: PASTA domain-containing protein [Parolsenella sp.]|uniref:PASTA domain-containing protein n=1 Tax=unclassified Parolsenella TaxID=2623992 RepID=UPI002A765F4D|nr:PASTA domain-containing protein [Parolsenella sp.]MCI5950677.1 PASTA domain-containing protein [Coriobacteriaceae bacterium]MDY3292612.1 PASTA domain-containing protein [Parolsenella sp.]
MKCPHCGRDLGEGLLPTRCPGCGSALSGAKRGHRVNRHEQRASADLAAASRRSVEGLSGMGAGRRSRGETGKRVARLFLGFLLVAVFCCLVFFMAYRAELIGGRTIPNVVGSGAEQATSRLSDKGFNVGVNEVESIEQLTGRVISTNPPAGTRADKGSTVTIDVAKNPETAAASDAPETAGEAVAETGE